MNNLGIVSQSFVHYPLENSIENCLALCYNLMKPSFEYLGCLVVNRQQYLHVFDRELSLRDATLHVDQKTKPSFKHSSFCFLFVYLRTETLPVSGFLANRLLCLNVRVYKHRDNACVRILKMMKINNGNDSHSMWTNLVRERESVRR